MLSLNSVTGLLRFQIAAVEAAAAAKKRKTLVLIRNKFLSVCVGCNLNAIVQ